MRRFVVGDIHGAHKALMQVLERSEFDFEKDKLICLGDVADGWPEVDKCFNTLLEMHNLVYIIGNHDVWFRDCLLGRLDVHDLLNLWLPQGGWATVESYAGERAVNKMIDSVPDDHLTLLDDARLWHEEEVGGEKHCFVHGGFHLDQHPSNCVEWELTWSRTLSYMPPHKPEHFDHVYIGHTQHRWDGPLRSRYVTNMDSGAGWNGVLTIMDIDTGDSWISDNVLGLYPDHEGRG